MNSLGDEKLIRTLEKVNENMNLLKGHLKTVFMIYVVMGFIAILLSVVTLWWVLR